MKLAADNIKSIQDGSIVYVPTIAHGIREHQMINYGDRYCFRHGNGDGQGDVINVSAKMPDRTNGIKAGIYTTKEEAAIALREKCITLINEYNTQFLTDNPIVVSQT